MLLCQLLVFPVLFFDFTFLYLHGTFRAAFVKFRLEVFAQGESFLESLSLCCRDGFGEVACFVLGRSNFTQTTTFRLVRFRRLFTCGNKKNGFRRLFTCGNKKKRLGDEEETPVRGALYCSCDLAVFRDRSFNTERGRMEEKLKF